MSSSESVIVWFRRDLRLMDHPALSAAVATGLPVIPVFVWDPDSQLAPGEAARWWLHQSLLRLDESLRGLGSRLIFRRGFAVESLLALADETGSRRVFFNHVHEPDALADESRAMIALRGQGIAVEAFDTGLLFPPDSLRTISGESFRSPPPGFVWARIIRGLSWITLRRAPLPWPHSRR